MSHPFPPRSSPSHFGTRVNGKIRAREVRVIGPNGQQMGVISLVEAINLARAQGVDLVEVAPNAQPPVCKIIDFGKYKYEQNKKEKESKKHQHANKVKEVQLSPKIDPHDFGVKLAHAIDFLCEDMKVKVVLKFRGREMAHKEIGFQQIEKFTLEVAPYGHPDNTARLAGRSITVMFSPLPRNKRAKNPSLEEEADQPRPGQSSGQSPPPSGGLPKPKPPPSSPAPSGGFANNPHSQLETNSTPP